MGGRGECERFYEYSTSKMCINIMAQWWEGAVKSFHVFVEGHKNILHVQAGGGATITEWNKHTKNIINTRKC